MGGYAIVSAKSFHLGCFCLSNLDLSVTDEAIGAKIVLDQERIVILTEGLFDENDSVREGREDLVVLFRRGIDDTSANEGLDESRTKFDKNDENATFVVIVHHFV